MTNATSCGSGNFKGANFTGANLSGFLKCLGLDKEKFDIIRDKIIKYYLTNEID